MALAVRNGRFLYSSRLRDLNVSRHELFFPDVSTFQFNPLDVNPLSSLAWPSRLRADVVGPLSEARRSVEKTTSSSPGGDLKMDEENLIELLLRNRLAAEPRRLSEVEWISNRGILVHVKNREKKK